MIDQVIKGLFEYGVVIIAGVQKATFRVSLWLTKDGLDAGENGEACQEWQDKFFGSEPGWEGEWSEIHEVRFVSMKVGKS